MNTSICISYFWSESILNHKAGQYQVVLARRSFWGHDGFCPCNTGDNETMWNTNLCFTSYAL